MSDNPLVNLEGFTKPVSDLGIALIKKIASAGYILHEPRQIREVAKAKAEAAEIQAESQIKITDLHRRALHRWIEEEAQYQRNIENITAKSINQLDEEADPHAIDDDWIVKFFDKSRLVSDDKMQDLWASILAGEANCVGAYSPKTLTTLADMDQKVARLFSAFCSLCIASLEDPDDFLKSRPDFKISDARVPIIRGLINDLGTSRTDSNLDMDKFAQKSESIYQEYGFGFSEFQLLCEYGLIQDDTFSDYSHFWYDNEMWAILKPTSTSGDYKKIRISGYCLSSVGKELFHITKRGNPHGYFKRLTDFLNEYYDVKIIAISSVGIG